VCVVTRIYVFEQVSCRIEPVRYPSRTNGFGSAERERRVRVPQVSRFSRPGRLCASLHCSLASVIPSPAKRSRGICGFRQPITDNRQPTPDNRQLLLEPEGRNNLSPGRKSWVGCSTNPEPASAGDTLFIAPPSCPQIQRTRMGYRQPMKISQITEPLLQCKRGQLRELHDDASGPSL